MSKLFSQMLAEMGFSLPTGRARFNRPMPTKSSQVNVDPNPNVPDTGITSGEDDMEGMNDMGGGAADQVPFDLGDDQIVILSAKALKKLLGGTMDDEGNMDLDAGEKLGYDDLPDEDELFGDEEGWGGAGADGNGGDPYQDDPEAMGPEQGDDGSPDGSGMGTPDGMGGMGSDESEEDPDRQGTIRQVKGAKLIYKRQQPDGTFSEMWAYNVGEGLQETLGVKRAILSGTDIPENHFESADGKQRYKIVTMGNAQLVKIEGLPN